MKHSRSLYIDNLRIVLTCLVVIHHLAIAYGGPGNWYYNEINHDAVSSLILSMFVATNQAFFMGMFFMISAYFLDKSLQRKSRLTLVVQKLKRLGIPLLLYTFVISPLVVYLLVRYDQGNSIGFVEFLKSGRGFGCGPAWFVVALLLFSLLSIAVYSRSKSLLEVARPLPRTTTVLLLVVVMALLSFFARINYPVGKSVPFLGFQLGHFPQYTLLFVVGLLASRNNWFSQIDYSNSIRWFLVANGFVFVVFPLGFYLGGATTGGVELFLGGLHAQSLFYCFWEQFVCMALIIGLLGTFRVKFSQQNSILQIASLTAYAVYIIHPLVLEIISLSFKEVVTSPTAKFLVLTPFALVCCFFAAYMLRKVPLLKSIL